MNNPGATGGYSYRTIDVALLLSPIRATAHVVDPSDNRLYQGLIRPNIMFSNDIYILYYNN
jgi:hypothetical protein